MGAHTKIEWCNHSINFWTGCTPVSEGCQRCYARAGIKRWGRDPSERRQVSRGHICSTLGAANSGDVVFADSWSDFFDPEVPHAWRSFAWEVFDARRDLIFVLLTKHPDNIEPVLAATCPTKMETGWPHVWLGVTAENQARADERIPQLLSIDWPGKKFISVEPMLGSINLLHAMGVGQRKVYGLSWVICGGESGPGARPLDLDWVRSLREQCVEAAVPFVFKQGSGVHPEKMPKLDGRVWDQRPEAEGAARKAWAMTLRDGLASAKG